MYVNQAKSSNSNALIDLRSDTVSRPSDGMRKAMAEADVGDDVYGDDPTVSALEELAADLLGKEAGLFVASGTQSNLVALLAHCGRGDEYIGGVGYHISKYEAGGAAVLGGISPRHLQLDENGGLRPDEVKAAIQPNDPHFARTKLVCIENTFNGRVQDQANMEAVFATAHDHGLLVHLDGARLMNASIASGQSASSLAAVADTVSLCLSKGLGAPVGSVLCGPKDFIHEARRNRKLVGGGLRQSGVLAACGLYALNHNVDRLAEDHENARELAERLSQLDGLNIELNSVHSNMIWMDVTGKPKGNLSEHMLALGMLVSDPAPQARLVCHLDFPKEKIEQVVDGFASWLA